MDRGGTGGAAYLQIEQIVSHHDRFSRFFPPDAEKLLNPLGMRFWRGFVPAKNIVGAEVPLEPDPAKRVKGNLPGVTGEDADTGIPAKQCVEQPSGTGSSGGFISQFIFDLDQTGMPERPLVRRQRAQELKDIGIVLRHPQRHANGREIVNRYRQRAIQIEDPATAGENVMMICHGCRIRLFDYSGNDRLQKQGRSFCFASIVRGIGIVSATQSAGGKRKNGMALPETEQQNVDTLLGQLCERRTIPDQVKLHLDTRGNRVVLTESRPLFIDPSVWNEIKIAQFEYATESGTWTLYWYDRKNRRQPYPTGRNRDILEKLVREVDSDPTGIFWE